MITAVFNDKMDYTIAYGLWQWDYGQVLRIKGLDFDQISIEVHFSLSPDNTNSLVTIGVVRDIDYQSTIVSDGEEYTVNETTTVLDVVIPKNMLWNNIKKNYTIYVFLLSTNEESGETLKRIIMPVKVKPKPLYSVTPEDEELFHRVVEEVNTFAETAKEHSNISKSYAVGDTGTRENEDIDNAKYYAEQSALSAEASEQSASNALVSENHALDSENSALGAESRARAYATEARDLKQEYDNTLALAKEYRDSAQASAISASANLRDTVTARNIATQASADANNFLNQTQAVYDLTVEIKQEVDETKADVDITKTEIDAVKTDINATQADITATRTEIATTRAEVNTAKNEVIAIKSEVSDIKDATDEIKTDVISIANNINNSISEHNESTTAHSDIRSLISNLTNKLNTFLDTDDESLDQISELITFIQNNRTLIEGITTSKVDKNQGIENAYKSLIVGEDGYVTLGDIGYYPVEITSVNSNYQANHTCKEISDAFKDGLIPYAFIHGVEQNIFYLMTCSESLVGFVYLTKDNISIITISQNNTVTVNTDNPIIHTHQDISHKADKATTLSGYGITNAYTKGEVDGIINNLDTGVTSVNNKTGNVTITAQELGALTEHQSLNGYATETWVNNQGYLTQHQSLADYALKSEIPTVPTKVSDLTNDAGYLTSHQDISGKADKSEIPTKTSDLTNDSGFLTSHQDISGKADKSEIPVVPTNVSAFTNDSGYINDLSSYIYYSQNSNTVYINSATETDADDVITINDRVTAVENDRYKPYVVDTASGAVASFMDGADDIPLKSLVVDINPVQTGSGDPSPDNVRPITGWTGAEVTRCGKNLLDIPEGSRTIVSGITVVTGDSRVSITGTGGSYSTYNIDLPITIPANSTLKLSGNASGNGPVEYRLRNKSTGEYMAISMNGIVKTPAFAVDRVQIATNPNVEYSYVANNIQLEFGSTATDYEPYQGDTYDITFPSEAGTVYGGSLDVTNGVLTVDKAVYTFDGTEGFAMVSNMQVETFNYFRWYATIFMNVIPNWASINSAIMTCYPVQNQLAFWYSGGIGKDSVAWTIKNYAGLCIKDSRYSTVEELKTSLIGQTIAYKLATPITYQLTPTEVKSILGSNNIWADCGDTTVEYRADTNLYVQRKIAEAISALS